MKIFLFFFSVFFMINRFLSKYILKKKKKNFNFFFLILKFLIINQIFTQIIDFC